MSNILICKLVFDLGKNVLDVIHDLLIEDEFILEVFDQLVVAPKNRGAPTVPPVQRARNRGAARATDADALLFFDADVVVKPDTIAALERVLEEMETTIRFLPCK